jgi:universal stress protein A
MPIQKILAPVDFSPASRKALETAIELAVATGATLKIVTAIEVLSYRGIEYESIMSPEAHNQQRSEANVKITEWADIARAAGATCESAVIDGDARYAILEHEKDTDVDLIIIGAKGHSRVHNLLLGSVVNEVSRSATCSVMVVR